MVFEEAKVSTKGQIFDMQPGYEYTGEVRSVSKRLVTRWLLSQVSRSRSSVLHLPKYRKRGAVFAAKKSLSDVSYVPEDGWRGSCCENLNE